MDPAVLESSLRILSESRVRLSFGVRLNEEPRLQQDLEAVADAKDQAAAVAKGAQLVAERSLQFRREDAASAEIIAEAESARDAEDLELIEYTGRGKDVVKAMDFDGRAGGLEREGGFFMTVGARRPN